MPTLDLKAVLYIIPVEATVKVIDEAFHRMGDVDWNGVIDGADLERIRAAFGSTPGSPNWDPECDLNGDGKVDLRDLVICSSNQGKTAPEFKTPSTVEIAAGRTILIGTFRGQTLRRDTTITTNVKVIFIYTILGFLSRVVIR